MDNEIMALGVDAGGTFTDFYAIDRDGASYTGKVNSTPEDPSKSIRRILDRFNLAGACRFVHGTTIATNALLEDELSDFVLVTNEGLEGLLTVGRGTRRDLYELNPDPGEVLKYDQPVLGVGLRAHPEGNPRDELTEDEIQRLRSRLKELDPDAVAICLVHAFRDSTHETLLKASLESLDVPVLTSSEVLPRFREYERASTTAVTAGLRPLVSDYLRTLADLDSMPSDRFVMGSDRGTLSFEEAIERPALTVLSGPAGGVVGAKSFLEDRDVDGVITMDIGGTSTDVSLIRDRVPLTDDHEIGGYPLSFPMVDVHTVGSGGGSIITIDRGGHLRVGPKSAGADPGPACYGRGGPPTLTDAQLLLGRIPRDRPLSEDLSLDADQSRRALAALGQSLGMNVTELARGALKVARSKLVEAIRKITVREGHKPSDFSLMGFGGAGGLFAVAVAEVLNVDSVFVPKQAGVASASGLLEAPRYRQRSVSPVASLSEPTEQLPKLNELLEKQPDWTEEGPLLEAECRFEGQSHSLTVTVRDPERTQSDLKSKFQDVYRDRFGYCPDEATVELVHLDASWRESHGFQLEAPGGERSSTKRSEQTLVLEDRSVQTDVRELESVNHPIDGPAVLSGSTTTLYVPPDWTVRPAGSRYVEVAKDG